MRTELTVSNHVISDYRIFVSFTDTFLGFVDGLEIQEGDRFAFGCDRRHIFREDDLIPREVTWASKFQPVHEKRILGKDVRPEQLNPVLLEKWLSFQAILENAENQGWIEYNIGNYPSYCQRNPKAIWPGHEEAVRLTREDDCDGRS